MEREEDEEGEGAETALVAEKRQDRSASSLDSAVMNIQEMREKKEVAVGNPSVRRGGESGISRFLHMLVVLPEHSLNERRFFLFTPYRSFYKMVRSFNAWRQSRRELHHTYEMIKIVNKEVIPVRDAVEEKLASLLDVYADQQEALRQEAAKAKANGTNIGPSTAEGVRLIRQYKHLRQLHHQIERYSAFADLTHQVIEIATAEAIGTQVARMMGFLASQPIHHFNDSRWNALRDSFTMRTIGLEEVVLKVQAINEESQAVERISRDWQEAGQKGDNERMFVEFKRDFL